MTAPDPKYPPAILIGQDSATGLQVARILAAHDVAVVAIVQSRRHWAARSRAVQQVVELDYLSVGLVDALLCDPRFQSGSVLIPCTDATVLLVAAHAAPLSEKFRLSNPPLEAVEKLLDKSSFARVAAAHDVPTARWVDLRSGSDPFEVLAGIRTPCVIKPARKDARWIAAGLDKVVRVGRDDDLVAAATAALGASDHLIIQEWVPGPDTNLVTCNVYIDTAGAVRASVTSRKLRQWPPATGTASSAVTTDDPEIAAKTAELLRSVDFTGMGYVEFKRHGETGDLVAIEANVGRPTGRSPMAEAAGVDMHFALYSELADQPEVPLAEVQTGVVWLHARRDLQAAIRQIRRGELSVRAWLQSLRGKRTYAVASWSDPQPFLLDVWVTIRKQFPGSIPARAASKQDIDSHQQEVGV